MPVIHRELPDGLVEPGPELAVDRLLEGGVSPSGHRFGRVPAVVTAVRALLPRDDLLDAHGVLFELAAPPFHQAVVGHDAVEPGAELRTAVELLQVPEDVDVSVLEGLLGVVPVAADLEGEAEDRVFVLAEEAVEGFGVARAGGGDQLGSGFFGRRRAFLSLSFFIAMLLENTEKGTKKPRASRCGVSVETLKIV